MKEEIKTILKMIEEGKISAEEGGQLIDQLQQTEEIKPVQTTQKSQFIHIEVKDDEENQVVKVNVPIILARTILKMGYVNQQISLHAPGIDIDFDEIIRMIESDAFGELVNVEAEGHKVRIWID